MRSFSGGAWVGAIAILGALAASAAAELRFADARPQQQAFRNAVYHCLEQLSAAPDAETREILEVVQRPAGMGRRHSIQAGSLPYLVGGVTTGHLVVRSDSSIVISTALPLRSKEIPPPVDDLVRLEFCSNLLHELKHARDHDLGEMDSSGPPPGEPGHGIRYDDIDARREENRWRRHVGLRQLTEYGGIPLPEDAIFR